MKLLAMKPAVSRATKGCVIALVITLGAGCASAETKLASKQDYRKQQVAAIKVQKEADIVAAQAAAAERVAMWNALSEAVKANPESASHMAIVAAVSTSSGNNANVVTRSNVVQLNKEREDAQAIDYLKVLTPGLIGGVTQAGIAAIVNETSRDRIQANRDVRIAEIGVDNAIVGAVNNAIDELDDDELSSTTTVTETVDDVTGPTPDSIVVDDSTDTSDTAITVDDSLDSGDSTTDDTSTDTEVDCSVTFSPVPPECAS